MWHHGNVKLAVVLSVNLENYEKAAKMIKELKKCASDWAEKEEGDQLIEWEIKPPDQVKCMSSYADQVLVPGDEAL